MNEWGITFLGGFKIIYFSYCFDEPNDVFEVHNLINTCFEWHIIHCQLYNEK